MEKIWSGDPQHWPIHTVPSPVMQLSLSSCNEPNLLFCWESFSNHAVGTGTCNNRYQYHIGTWSDTFILIIFKILPYTSNLVSISFQSKLATVQVNYRKEKREEVDLLIVTPELFPFEDYNQRFGSVTFLLRIRILGSVHWIRDCFCFLIFLADYLL
jgi:hypothetical protein